MSVGIGKIFHPAKPSGDDDKKYSWSLPYFHGTAHTEKILTSWHSFDDAPDNKLRDGQIADRAVSTIYKN